MINGDYDSCGYVAMSFAPPIKLMVNLFLRNKHGDFPGGWLVYGSAINQHQKLPNVQIISDPQGRI